MPFFEKSEEEILIEQAKEIMARTQAKHPGQPILFREYYSAEERPVMDAYRELLLQKDPFRRPSASNTDQAQGATIPVPPVPASPFQPLMASVPFVAPYALYTKPIHQLVQNITKKA